MDIAEYLTLSNIWCQKCGASINPCFYPGQESTFHICSCGYGATFHRPRDPVPDSSLSTKPRKEYSAKSLITRAAELVSGSRAVQHGPKERNHQNIARHWNAYLGDQLKYPLDAEDVALMMGDLKIARAKGCKTMGLSPNPDNFVDLAGYAGVAGEIALNGGEEKK